MLVAGCGVSPSRFRQGGIMRPTMHLAECEAQAIQGLTLVYDRGFRPNAHVLLTTRALKAEAPLLEELRILGSIPTCTIC